MSPAASWSDPQKSSHIPPPPGALGIFRLQREAGIGIITRKRNFPEPLFRSPLRHPSFQGRNIFRCFALALILSLNGKLKGNWAVVWRCYTFKFPSSVVTLKSLERLNAPCTRGNEFSWLCDPQTLQSSVPVGSWEHWSPVVPLPQTPCLLCFGLKLSK